MALIEVTRQAGLIQAYQLTSQGDMITALSYIAAGGYFGHINLDANGVWTMGFTNTAQGVSHSAKIDDWVIIENNAIASIATPAQFAELYQV